MKANDNIPADEMLLAEAIAAAKANGLGWCRGFPFLNESRKERTTPEQARHVCALGALHIAGKLDMVGDGNWFPYGRLTSPRPELRGVLHGNDNDDRDWEWDIDGDNGESLGWAFRCAMTQEDES